MKKQNKTKNTNNIEWINELKYLNITFSLFFSTKKQHGICYW